MVSKKNCNFAPTVFFFTELLPLHSHFHFIKMNNLNLSATILTIPVFLFFSCSNDFQLTEGQSDIPVIYGMLSPGDTATYIRVERAFIDENTSALTLAKDISRLYFDNPIVRIQHIKTGKVYTLSRVDGNLDGYKRASGAFADAPNYLYKIRKTDLSLIAGDQYKLIISKNDGIVLSEALTAALVPLKNEDLTSPGPTASLSFINNLDFKFRWFGDENAVIHDVRFNFFIKEDKNGNISDKIITWNVVTNTDKTDFNVKGIAFYEFMQGAFTDKSPTIKRYFQNASLTITSGGKEIKDYIGIGQANLGITSSGEIPIYSNLSNGGLGIFSSTTSLTRSNIGLTNNTLDSLRNGVITKSLNFQ
jgi:hypothetical protein